MTLIATRAAKSKTRTAALSLLIGLAAALAISSFAAPAYGEVTDEQREGQQILRSVESGDRRCPDLVDADFERVGEYVMGRMAGSSKAHEQMNQLMSSMMGARGEEQVHEFMGRRFAGCGRGKLPGGFAGMMGSIGMMGGGRGAQSNGYGSMMGGASSNEDDGDWGTVAFVMTVLMAALFVVVAVLLFRRPSGGKGSRSAFDILGERYARGEIDSEEYDKRRKALRGS